MYYENKKYLPLNLSYEKLVKLSQQRDGFN